MRRHRQGHIEISGLRACHRRIVASPAEAQHLPVMSAGTQPNRERLGLLGEIAVLERVPLVADVLGGAAGGFQEVELEHEAQVRSSRRTRAPPTPEWILAKSATAEATTAETAAAEQIGEQIAEVGVDVLGGAEAVEAHILDS